ncbi:4895_t:CDS:2, partial [Acaulospora colombiana]
VLVMLMSDSLELKMIIRIAAASTANTISIIVSDVVVKNMPSPGMLVTVVKTDAVVDMSAVVVIICALGVVVVKNVTILVIVGTDSTITLIYNISLQYVKVAKSIIMSVADIVMTATNWVL